jgi:hypothetical protein
MMSTANRIQLTVSGLLLAAIVGSTVGNPVSPTDGAGATIAGTVIRSTESPGLTVAVVGTGLSAAVERSGYFQISRVPEGYVQLQFKDAVVDAGWEAAR